MVMMSQRSTVKISVLMQFRVQALACVAKQQPKG
jgi:hypothetical protein